MSPTRRSLLQSVVSAGLVGFAGCATSSNPSPTRSPSPDPDTRSGSVTEPAVSKPRNPDENVVLRTRERDETDVSEANGTATAATTDRVHQKVFVDDDDLSDVAFADGVPRSDVSAARGFLEETDFDDQSVFFRATRIESCRRYRIQSVSWEPDHVEYEFCRELRPPTHTCTVDTWDAVGLFIRIPAPLSSDVSRMGASGHSPCRASDTEYRQIDANATVEGPRVVAESNESETRQASPEDQGGDS